MMKKYKIVLFNDSLVGGAGKSILVLAEALEREGIEVHIVIYENNVDFNVPKNIHLHLLQNLNPKNKKQIANTLEKKINQFGKLDLIISNSTPSNKILSIIKQPNIYHCVRSTETKHFYGFFKYIRSFLRKGKYRKLYTNKNLITVSKGLEEIITNNIRAFPESIQTIYEPFDFTAIAALSKKENNQIPNEDYLIHVGRFDLVSKRQDILLHAYKKANLMYPLVLLGDGEDRKQIEELIHELKLENKVLLPGFSKNPFPWIKKAKLFIFSSDFEGFGRVLVEALALKTPVVSTDCPSGPSEIMSGVLSDYLVPVGDVEALAIKIKEALDYYPDISEHIIDKFSDVNIANKYIKLIEENNVKSKT